MNDLTGAVRKKRKAPAVEGSDDLTEDMNGKRKAEDGEVGEVKKVKVE